jgi:DNA polymerase
MLRRYLRQRLEAGEREVFLDQLDAAGVLALLREVPGGGDKARRGEGGIGEGRGAGLERSGGGAAAPGISASARAGARDAAATGASGLLQALAEHAPGVLGQGGQGGAVAGTGRVGNGTGTGVGAAAGAGLSERPASEPDALRVLGGEVAGCVSCRLHEGRRNVVFGEGNAAAEVVVVGEAPGGEEDRTGRPFVGPAGKLLDLLLLSAGFPREEVYICNVLKCRPPDNRDPLRDEVEACSSHLRRQLDAIRPTVLLAVGKFAAQTLTGSDASIGTLRGGVHTYHGIPLVVTYHPAFLLRSPQWARSAWHDFQLLREVLETRRRGA